MLSEFIGWEVNTLNSHSIQSSEVEMHDIIARVLPILLGLTYTRVKISSA